MWLQLIYSSMNSRPDFSQAIPGTHESNWGIHLLLFDVVLLYGANRYFPHVNCSNCSPSTVICSQGMTSIRSSKMSAVRWCNKLFTDFQVLVQIIAIKIIENNPWWLFLVFMFCKDGFGQLLAIFWIFIFHQGSNGLNDFFDIFLGKFWKYSKTKTEIF